MEQARGSLAAADSAWLAPEPMRKEHPKSLPSPA